MKDELPPGGREANLPEAPFLSNPTDCSLEREISVTARSYQLPESPSTMSAPFPQIIGCGKLDFEPELHRDPDQPRSRRPHRPRRDAEDPPGRNPQGLATSTLKSAVVTLPEGMTINPAAGDGLDGLQLRRSASANHRTLPLPRRGQDRLGRNRRAGSGKHPQRRGLPAHPRTRPPLPLLARHRRTGRAPEAAGRNRGQPADRPGDDHLQRASPPSAATRRCRSRASAARLRRPAGAAGDALHLRHLPDPLRIHALVGQAAAEGDTPMQITSGCDKGGFCAAA